MSNLNSTSDPSVRQTFHLGDILSIITGNLVTPDGTMDGVYRILNFMSNDDLSTVQLPRVSDECKPYLREQFPQLANITGVGITRENWRAWLADKVAQYGEYHEVRPMHLEDHENLSPAEDIYRINPNAKVINFPSDDDEVNNA
jgi:hypothetical protein